MKKTVPIKLRRAFSGLIALLMLITGIMNGLQFDFSAFAAGNMDSQRIANFEFGNTNYVVYNNANDYTARDSENGAIIKSASWNPSGGAFHAGSDLYNQNGYLYGDFNALAGKDAYRIELKMSKETEEATNALLMALGTSAQAKSITDADTANVLQLHQDGRLYIYGRDKGTIADLALPTNNEETVYSFRFDGVSKYFYIFKNGTECYSQVLSEDEISGFKNVHFVSLGTQASNSNYGNYVGAIACHYYYLRAFEDVQYAETVDRITVDPVIYTHGEKTAEGNDYGYMMYGTAIADGTVNGEQITTFQLPQGATIESVACTDASDIEFKYASGKYYLTGHFDSDVFKAADGAQIYTDLQFKYKYNAQTYIETHRFAVKTNPVATHGMIYGQAYRNINKGNKAAVAFQTVALGSVGSLSQSRAKATAWGGQASHTYRANSWNLYAPYDSAHNANDDSSGSLKNAFVNKSDDAATVDKVAGFGVTGDNGSSGTGVNKVDIGAETEVAQYYVDKSASSILGAKHTAGESAYSIDLFTENIYQSFNTSNGTVHIVQHEFNPTQGTLDVQINSNWSQEDGAWKWYNAWDNNQKNSESVTLTGSTDDGSVIGTYWTAGYNYTGKEAKATILLNVQVNVFDKTQPRTAYTEFSTAFNSKYYDATKWETYKNAKLALEGLLGNYEISEIASEYQTNLETAYEELGSICDYSALIAALQQSRYALDNAKVYQDTEQLQAAFTSVLDRAFYAEDVDASALQGIENWKQKMHDQAEIDKATTQLQFIYTEATLNKANISIQFSVYLDDALVAKEEYHTAYKQNITLDAAALYTDAGNYETAKWSMGGITVANEGLTYALAPKTNTEIACYLISKPSSAQAQCKVTLLDYSARKEMDFYVSQQDTYSKVLSVALKYTDEILYYAISGWEINGSASYHAAETLNGQTSITVRPVYTPTVNDYKLIVSGGNMESENGFVFDTPAYISFDAENTPGDFLCWAVKFDDTSYRVASYNQEYNFYVSGNMSFLAITTENFNKYQDKLQKNTTEQDKTPQVPEMEDLQNKTAIPSLRGQAEDAGAISGAVWNAEAHKLYVIGQVADGSSYDSCGLVLMYGGKTVVTPSVSQTKSGQYMMTYKLGASYSDRSYTILAYSKSGEGGTDIMYSPSVEVTVPADNPTYTVGNGNTVLNYNSRAGKYDIVQNGNVILSDVSSEFKLGTDGSVIDVSSYNAHACTKKAISDNIGAGVQLTVVSKKAGLPNVEQTFKVYDNKDYILTDFSIQFENSDEISSNYMAPVVASGSQSFMLGNAPWSTFLYTPMDNDSWSKFLNYSLSSTDNVTSHEVAALYNPQSKDGLIVGSVTHDQWKSGVSYEGSSASGLSGLKVFGGAKTIEISSDNPYRGEEEHGAVKGKCVQSPTMFIGNYSNWQDGMMEFTSANTAITPMREQGDLGGVPFGWNSWGSIADSLTIDNALGNINYIKDNFQSTWTSSESGENDGTPVVMNLDSWWNEIKLDGSNDEALKAFVAQCKANGQIPGIYHTPFVSWASEEQMNNPDESWWTHPERVLRKSDGSMYDSIDGGYPLDVTREDVIQETINRIQQFKELGFQYVKLDFMSHGYLEGQFANSDITTGAEAYNYAMTRILEEVNKDYGSQLFINLSIAPIFPYQYANGRRMGCDSWYSTENTQYTLNQLTYGFWERGIYQYPDPDHAVIYGRSGNATQAQAKNVMTLNAAVAGNMLLGDSFVEYTYKEKILGIEYNKTYNPSGAIKMANNVLWNPEIVSVAKKNKIFRSVMDDTAQYANVYKMEDNGDIYYAVFNFSGNNTYRLEIPTDGHYKCEELWSGEVIREQTWAWIDVQVNGEDSKIYKFSKVN